MPTQKPNSLSRCRCGETFDSQQLAENLIYVPHITAAKHKESRAIRRPALRNAFMVIRLFQRGADIAKVGVEVRTNTLHGGDDGNRDTCCDQTILDSRCAGFVFPKAR